MKKNNIFRQTYYPVYMIALATLLFSSCREESDLQTSYGNDDVVAMENVTNFASSFKVLWEGLNNGYCIWDYEEEQGVDWDAVYDEFYPKFAALDDRTDSVSDNEVQQLMNASFGQLHDGHLTLKMKNFRTGNLVICSPQSLRIQKRDDYEVASSVTPSLLAYLAATDDNQIVDQDVTNFSFGSFLNSNLNKAYKYNTSEIDSLKAISTPAQMDIYKLTRRELLKNEMDTLFESGIVSVSQYNVLVQNYSDLKNPYLLYYDPTLVTNPLTLRYARFKDDILYLSFNAFVLTLYLSDNGFKTAFPFGSAVAVDAANQVKRVYGKWFDAVQSLKKSGKLKGIIIDLRGNSGGIADDNQYIMGALQPSGSYEFARSRYKRGVGRLDYSPLFPQFLNSSTLEHEVIDQEPVVVLTNCNTVSMAEITTLQAKKMSNGRVIGKRTWGGLCMLFSEDTRNAYNVTYSGSFGDTKNGPVFAYVPFLAAITDYGILEAKGVEPDIEVDFDLALYKNEGRDSQIERALQYIRTGN